MTVAAKPPANGNRSLFRSSMKDASINVLTLDAMDCISKEPDYKKCAVKIEKA